MLEVAVTGLIAYATLIVLLRLFGKRTLATLNAFDLVVTVALGSTLASIALPENRSLADGLVVLVILLGAQFGVSWLQIRSPTFRRLVKNEPTLLYYQGRWLESRLRRERVTKDEVLSAVRNNGKGRMAEVMAVVLETNGSLSIVAKANDGPTLNDVADSDGRDDPDPR